MVIKRKSPKKKSPEQINAFAAELTAISISRALDCNRDVIATLRGINSQSGPGPSRLRRKATSTDGMWSDLAKPF